MRYVSQREGQTDISYILVVFGGVNGECMCKWYMYTHILTWFMFVFMKSGIFCMKDMVLFMKRTEKHLKNNNGLTPDSTQMFHFDLVFHSSMEDKAN